ncbi:MAG: hypothetical protein KAS72_00625 [Phycisphaerales bacterium]|nr:hypothetical protein [Phycisphaerales bacterium]
MADDFDNAYRQTEHVYGEAPDPLLAAHHQHIQKSLLGDEDISRDILDGALQRLGLW